jgi:hypothetical protein
VAQAKGDVDVDHLVNEHGIDRALLNVRTPDTRTAQRHLALFYEFKHSTDHAQRKVGHDHT